jgi:dienelactone hydrolase
MRRSLEILAGFMAVIGATSAVAAPDERALGDWIGTVGPAQLHLAIHIRRTGAGLDGTMDSLDQGVVGMPLAAVKADADALSFDVPAAAGHYSGRWDPAARRYAGEWSQPKLRQPLLLSRGTAAARPAVAGLDGDWDGKLKAGPLGELRLVFHVRTGAAGTIASLESPDQGPGELPFSAVARQGDRITLEAKAIGARFEGRLSADGSALDGIWHQGGQDMPLALRRRSQGAAGPAAARRPQMPHPPYPYREEEVSYDNPAAHNRLAGTLTLPAGKGPFPAALLITGSGQQDRDETLMGHKPFLVLADYLTRRGIAVLRVDDRGIGGSTGDAKGTTADFATDTEAGIAFLLARPDIDHRRIGLIGHSEGGAIAPMVAARNRAVGWIVLLAGPGVTGERVVLSQQRLIMAAGGVPAETIERNAALQQRLLAAVEKAPDREAAQREAKAVLIAAGMPEATAEANSAPVSSDWYRGFLKLDPVPALRSVKVPVLALVGSLDVQVPASENIPALKAALAGNRDATVIQLPGLNHLFQTARTGAVAEYAQIEETVSPVALKTVGDWIAARTR